MTKIKKIIRHQEEVVTIEHGRVWKGKELSTDKPTTWTEEVNMILRERKLDIRNQEKEKIIIRNATIMDDNLMHAKSEGLKTEIVNQIIHVRLIKKIVLSLELAASTGR